MKRLLLAMVLMGSTLMAKDILTQEAVIDTLVTEVSQEGEQNRFRKMNQLKLKVQEMSPEAKELALEKLAVAQETQVTAQTQTQTKAQTRTRTQTGMTNAKADTAFMQAQNQEEIHSAEQQQQIQRQTRQQTRAQKRGAPYSGMSGSFKGSH